MEIIKYSIIGIIQGLTEFLPVSSSGHIVILSKLLNIDADNLLLSIVAHLGTLIAVLIIYRKEVFDIISHPTKKNSKLLIIATIPTILIVLLLNNFIDSIFSGTLLVISFLLTAMFLFLVDLLPQRNNPLDYKSAFIMGTVQGFAIFPGISRSGSTLISGIIIGLDKEKATDFSFIMSIPIIICSLLYEIFIKQPQISSSQITPLIFAFITSFIFGIISIKFMLKFIKKVKLKVFAIYLIILSAILVIL